MNYYRATDGTKYPQSVVERKIRETKRQLIENTLEKHGYIFCFTCGMNRGLIDCAHIVSVDRCKKAGQVEKAWEYCNIYLECRECHQKRDKLNIQSGEL